MENGSELEEIWSVFGEESKENLELIEDLLLNLENCQTSPERIAALFRSMHTVKGGARMMGLSVLESLAHHAEDLVALVRDEHVPLDCDLIGLLLQVVDRLRQLLEKVMVSRQDVAPDEVRNLTAVLEAALAAHRGGSQGGSSGGSPAAAVAAAPAKQPEDHPEPVPAPPPEPAPEPLPEPLPETPFEEPPSLELIDLAADPTSVRIFFDMAADSLKEVDLALRAWQAGRDPQALERVEISADSLAYAAGQMGYQALQEALQGLLHLSQANPQSAGLAGDLVAQAGQVVSELAAAGQRYADLAPVAVPAFALEPGPALSPEPVEETDQPEAGNGWQVSSGVMQNLLDTIGELTGDHTSLHHLMTQLIRKDLSSAVLGLVKKYQAEPKALVRELERYLDQWTDDLATLAQVETKEGVSLSRLQELGGSLGISLDRKIVDGMVVRAGRYFYLIPIQAIRRIDSILLENLIRSSAGGSQRLFRVEDELLPVCTLAAGELEQEGATLLVIVDSAAGSFALQVDELVGQQRSLVLPLHGQLEHIRNVSGCVLLGDGEVGMVLAPDQVRASL